jgi:hypothetical protein
MFRLGKTLITGIEYKETKNQVLLLEFIVYIFTNNGIAAKYIFLILILVDVSLEFTLHW